MKSFAIAKPYNNILFKVLLFITVLFGATLVFNLSSSTPAFADHVPCAGLGAIDQGTGNANQGVACGPHAAPPSPADCTSTSCPGQPARTFSGEVPNLDDVTFFVGCDFWSLNNSLTPRQTSYQLSQSCTTGLTSIDRAATALHGGEPLWRSGGLRWYGTAFSGAASEFASGCNANGENSAYGGNFRRQVSFTAQYAVYVFDGNLEVTREVPGTRSYLTNYTRSACLYPVPVTGVDLRCYYNYNGTSYFSRDIGAIQNGGETQRPPRGALPGDPRPPVWNGNPGVAPQCDRTGSPNVVQSQDLSVNGYGYYRLVPTFNWDRYLRTDWVAGTTVLYSRWTNTVRNAAGDSRGWFVYSCQADNPYEGRFDYANLPNRNAFFNVASCPQVNWRCEIADSTTSGGIDRATIPNGQTQVNTVVSVIRNGEPVPITFSRLRVVDVTNGVTTDITNGGVGSGVRNIERLEYRSLVRNGSTPFNGTNINSGSQLNASNQYFRLFTSPAGTTVEPWTSWRQDANTNLDKSLAFYWATETANGSFAAQRQWRVTAEFFVPQGTTIDSGGNFGSFTYQWVRDTKNCFTVDGSGAQTTTLLTAASNPIRVVRSVNDVN